MQLHPRTSLLTYLLPLALVASCGGGGGAVETLVDDGVPGPGGDDTILPGGDTGGDTGGSDEPSGPLPTTLEESLQRFHIDTAQTPRLIEGDDELPEDFSPLGSRWDYTRQAEIFLAGADLDGDATLIEDLGAQDHGPASVEWLQSWNGGMIPEHGSDDWKAFASRRAFAAVDVDGNGKDDIVRTEVEGSELRCIVTLSPGALDTRNVVFSTTVLPSMSGVYTCEGDLDGDSAQELAVACVAGDEIELLILDWAAETFEIVFNAPIETTIAGSTHSLELATGNLDYDQGEELTIVLNQHATSELSEASFAIYDDADRNYDVIHSGAVIVGESHAKVADVAMPNLDDDPRSEIVFGGLEDYYEYDVCERPIYLMTGFDDLERGLAKLPDGRFQHVMDCDGNRNWYVGFVPTTGFDMDNDRVDEVIVGHRVLNLHTTLHPDGTREYDWRTVDNDDIGLLELPTEVFFDPNTSYPTWFARSTADRVAGDVDGDGNDEILTYRQWDNRLRVFSAVHPSGEIGFYERYTLPVGGTQNQPNEASINPCLLAPDVDDDSVTLVRTSEEHRLVFTEPVMIAAMAAPPASVGIGQNLDATVTSLEQSETASSDSEYSFSVSGSVTTGLSFSNDITQSEFSAKISTEVTAGMAFGSTYEVTKSVVFETGPIEDTVVFACLPMDQYIYTVAKHYEDHLVNQEIVVSVPREPVVLQTTVDFYNENMVGSAVRIDERIFAHTAGDHRSYRSASSKDHILQKHGLDASALQAGPQHVPQGSGSESLSIEIGSATSNSTTMSVYREVEVEATVGGVVGGFTVGSEAGSSMTITTGSSSVYSGTVGAIPSETFVDNGYKWGIFTHQYVDPDSNQAFSVIDYWVE